MELIKKALDTILFDEDEALLSARLTDGDENSRVAVLVGDNASGKSLFVRLLTEFCKTAKPRREPIQVSMRHRTATGMHRAFMYGALGDEIDSTGNVSMIAVTGAVSTAKGRETPNWLMLDEPDTGLSESYARALGNWLAQEFDGLGARTEGVVLVTHSRALVESLFRHSSHRPWFVHMGGIQTPQEWLADTTERSVADLLGMAERSMTLYRAIHHRTHS